MQELQPSPKRRKTSTAAATGQQSLGNVLSAEIRVALLTAINNMTAQQVRVLRGDVEKHIIKTAVENTVCTLLKITAASLNTPWSKGNLMERICAQVDTKIATDAIAEQAGVLIDQHYLMESETIVKKDILEMIAVLPRDALEQYFNAIPYLADSYATELVGSFQGLPLGIWCKIIGMLTCNDIMGTCSRVSKLMLKLSCSYPVWSGITSFRFGSRLLQNEHIPSLIMKLPNLKGIKFGKYVRNDKMFELISSLDSRKEIITSLNFSSGPACINDPLFETLFRSRLPWNLREINLSSCRVVSDATLKLISQNCPRLQNLNLKLCFRISDNGLYFLSKGCPDLEILTLRYCVNVTDLGLINLGDGCKKLSIVSFRNCVQLSDEGVQALSKSGSLTRVSFSKCIRLTDTSLQSLAEYCPKLEYAHFAFCSEITNSGVFYLANRCRDLRNVDLSMCQGITESAVFGLADKCPRLEHLCLKGCSQIQNDCSSYVYSRCCRLSKLCIPSDSENTGEEDAEGDDL